MAENIVVYNVRVDVESGKIAIDGLTKGFVKAETAVKKLNGTIQETTTKGLNPMIDKTGLAGATVVELGRTISDSNYGIRGMANNLSQLATLMTTLIVTTKGVANGFRALWAALMGPLGIIVVFQTVIAVIESFAIKNQGASKTTKELTASINEETEALQALINVTGDANGLLSEELELRKAQLALKIANKKLVDIEISQADKRKKLEEQLMHFKQSLQELDEQAIKYRQEGNDLDALMIEEGKRKIILNKLISENTQELNGLNEERNKLDEDYLETLERLNELELERRLNAPNSISLYQEYIKRLKDFQQNSATSAKEFEAAAKAIIYWENQIKKISGDPDALKKLDKAIEEGSDRRLEALEAELKAIQQLLDEYSGKLFDKAEKEEPIRFFDYDFDDLDVDIAIDELLDKNKKADQARIDSVNRMADAAQAFGDILSGIAGIMDAEFEKQMDVEQNKTTALNNQLRERLANEQLSANERENIQSQISTNDEKLRKKQEEIAKKRFKTEKAMRISIGLVDTAASALKAYGSQLIVGDPSSFIRAKVAAGIATALGLAQVAMISKQQFIGSASATPPGVGGSSLSGGAVQAPDFNIVGASQTNQIAEAIQGKLQTPIKAYVVSKDVSTAQEMDRNIVGTASLG